MKLDEFKAWLEGFEEAISGSPNKAQWTKIKARLASVDNISDVQVIEKHYRDWNPYRPYWSTGGAVWMGSTNLAGSSVTAEVDAGSSRTNALAAFVDLGKQEALQA